MLLPVIRVSWYEAQAYSSWARLRLTTEMEWRKAARDEIPDAKNQWRANYYNEPVHGRKQTSPVGKFPLGGSPYGCLDMSGNVWEWCEDSYGIFMIVNLPLLV